MIKNRIEKLIWMRSYSPFAMGGDVHAPVGIKTKLDGPFDIGKGYSVYLAKSPDGLTVAIEPETGAVIGDSLEDVREDVSAPDHDPKILSDQLKWAREQMEIVRVIPNEEFWSSVARMQGK